MADTLKLINDAGDTEIDLLTDVFSIKEGTLVHHGPVQDVNWEPVALFAKVGEELGFIIEEIRAEFPDCIARRQVDKGWERVAIEFEFKSSNFQRHGHDPEGCDLIVCYEKSTVTWIFRLFMGGTPDEVGQRYRAASPVTYVSQDDPPVLTLHGDQDALVPVEQAITLDAKMKAAGAVHQLTVFEGQRHGFRDGYQQKAKDAMWAFFDQHLQLRAYSTN